MHDTQIFHEVLWQFLAFLGVLIVIGKRLSSSMLIILLQIQNHYLLRPQR